jgi:lipopolysaccharide transport system ATP-binding protein
MLVRLAFAVAAHLEPEILVIDEVLAVGDAEFQRKCLGKMQDVSQKEGRTVLFVSHNESAVRELCSHAILLEKGRIKMVGTPSDAFRKYKEGQQLRGFSDKKRIHKSKTIRILNATLMDNGTAVSDLPSGIQPHLEIEVAVFAPITFSFETILRDANSYPIMFASPGINQGHRQHSVPGQYRFCLHLKFPKLAEGRYSLDLMIADPGVAFFEYLEEGLVFTVLSSNKHFTGWVFQQTKRQGCILLETTIPEVCSIK